MIEKRIGSCTIVAPEDDPQSASLNELNHVIERNDIVRRTSLSMERVNRRRFTLVLIREPSYFDIAEIKLPHQTLENHQPFRALDSIVIEMSVSGENDV